MLVCVQYKHVHVLSSGEHAFDPSTRKAEAGGSLISDFSASLAYIISSRLIFIIKTLS